MGKSVTVILFVIVSFVVDLLFMTNCGAFLPDWPERGQTKQRNFVLSYEILLPEAFIV